MKPIFLIFTIFSIKDWFILIILLILLLCILEISRLKKVIVQETKKRLIPQLKCELVLDANPENMGLYLTNESFFLANDIKIEDVWLTLDDFGYKVNLFLKFEDIDSLGAQEKTKLKPKVFDQNQNFEPRLTESIIPHLFNPSFKIKISYSNIEGIKFHAVFVKKNEKFYTEKIEACPRGAG